MEKHQTYLERDINRLNELFDNQIDFTREGDVDTLYLFVDKRIQYHDNGTNRHAIPIFMLAYLFENNSSKRQLILSDVFLIPGNRENIKLTTPFDLKVAEVLV